MFTMLTILVQCASMLKFANWHSEEHTVEADGNFISFAAMVIKCWTNYHYFLFQNKMQH